MTVKRTILVVDDDPDIRRMLRRMLESDGYHVVEAADGLEALGRLRLEPGGHLGRLRGIPRHELLDQPKLDGQGNELLLGAVVDVPFQAAAFIVLGRHETLAGGLKLLEAGAQLGSEPDVPKHQPGL